MRTAAFLALPLAASLALGADTFEPARVEIQAPPPREAQPEAAAPANVELDAPAARVEFGKSGSKWWTIGGGVANNFSDATDVNVFGSYSYFLAQDVEVAGELGAWYYALGEDAFGLNASMVFRWHFVNTQKWTVYGDLGIGGLVTTDDVPGDGTSLNFTPRAGAGFTRRLGDSNTRLQVGVRWAHISNGRTSGDDDNPSRDSIMLYGGFVFPF